MSSGIKYFPFTPEVPWKVSNGIILPKMEPKLWKKLVNTRTPVIFCYGGLFESYFSLACAEVIHRAYPYKSIYWCGNKKFSQLINLSGIVSINQESVISEECRFKYPTPLFLDRKKHVYFNCLNNYINLYNYLGKKLPFNINPLTQQIFDNVMVPWKDYFPILRKLKQLPEFDKWRELKKFNINRPFLAIFPDNTGWSEHKKISFLGWSIHQIRSFVAMVNQIGLEVVIVTPHVNRYYGIKALIIEPKLEQVLYIIEKAKFLLSNELDFIFLKMLNKEPQKIICKKLMDKRTYFRGGYKKFNKYSIISNQEFLNTDHNIVCMENMEPFKVFMEIKGN
jgi:hypothetical protein